jgi:hypothetical protein
MTSIDPAQLVIVCGGVTPQELHNMLMDPHGQVGRMMDKYGGHLPVAPHVIEAVIRPNGY